MDAIASEYGWDDDVLIHDKPISRLLLWFAAIALRKGHTPAEPSPDELDRLDQIREALG